VWMRKIIHSITRREFVKTSAGVLATAGLSRYLGGCSKANDIPLGVQLYSVRAECEKDFPKTIEAVAKMGYQGVEFAGYYNYSAPDMRKLLDDNGLQCCGTHTGMDTVLGDNLKETIEYNQILGNRNLIVPWIGEEYRSSKEAWIKTAGMFNELAEKLKADKMRIGYHNHAVEYEPIDGEIPWDIFAQNTNQEVILQIDTGNAGMAGANAVEYIKKYPGRTVTIHVKAYSTTNEKALIGEDEINWMELFSVCEATGGTEWYIIEEEKDAYTPLEGIQKSLENYHKLRT
jgi:sugar phosphate isomerase/epimerase